MYVISSCEALPAIRLKFPAVRTAVALLCLGLPPLAGAQTAVGDTLPQITVSDTQAQETPNGPANGYVARRSLSASKTDTSLLETPQSISVVTRQQMDDQAAQTLDAALRYTPAVYSQDNDIRFDQLSVRGFSADSYLDGLKLVVTNWFVTPRIDPYFLERAEVLRGPTSVLYGQGSPGGIVNMVSRMPTEETFHRIDMQAGNHDRYQLGFDVGGPLNGDGTVLYRVTGLGRAAGSQTDYVKEQRMAIAPSLTIKASGDTKITFLSSLQYDPKGGLFNPVPPSGSVLANGNGRIPPSRYLGDQTRDGMTRTQASLGYILDHRLNDTWSFRQNARYLHDDIDYYQSSVSSPLGADGRTAGIWANINNEHLTNFAIDNQLTGKFKTGGLQQTLLAGVDYQRTLAGINRGGAMVGSIDIFNPDYSALPSVSISTLENYSLTQGGLYLQDQARLGRWLLTLGGRQDWTTSDDVQRSAATGAVAARARQSDSAFTWRAGLNYVFDGGVSPYMSYATSFAPSIGTNSTGGLLKPTTGKQVEVGVKYQPAQTDALFTAALFNLVQQNVQTADPNNAMLTVQTGEIRSRGLELEARANLTRQLKFIASYTYQQLEVTKSNDGNEGKKPVEVPEQMASVWLDYTMGRFGAAAGVRYVGASAGNAENTLEVPSHTLVDAALRYDYDQHWRLALNAANLFNKEYVAYCSNNLFCYWGQTRSVLATVTYRW
ncbi:TonB-dependent siderophore receptor [Herbaspirillum chlorophenolicum]|uniref:TonB-dependent siderophore receptor n=1 Tax=Herbaspirillum chlorophenolicum TaxID=211589 RepID=A0ABW8ESX5_9BURK